jgi:hypothetical protein
MHDRSVRLQLLACGALQYGVWGGMGGLGGWMTASRRCPARTFQARLIHLVGSSAGMRIVRRSSISVWLAVVLGDMTCSGSSGWSC